VALAQDPARRAALAQAGTTRAARFDAKPAAARLDRLRGEILAAWSRGEASPI